MERLALPKPYRIGDYIPNLKDRAAVDVVLRNVRFLLRKESSALRTWLEEDKDFRDKFATVQSRFAELCPPNRERAHDHATVALGVLNH